MAPSYVYANSGCVAATLAVCLVSLFVCVCVSLVRAVIICPASTRTALVSSPRERFLGRLPCSRARETCRQGCQVRANGAVHASHNRERDALCMVGHVVCAFM